MSDMQQMEAPTWGVMDTVGIDSDELNLFNDYLDGDTVEQNSNVDNLFAQFNSIGTNGDAKQSNQPNPFAAALNEEQNKPKNKNDAKESNDAEEEEDDNDDEEDEDNDGKEESRTATETDAKDEKVEEKEEKKEVKQTDALHEMHRGTALLKYPANRSNFPTFKHIELSPDNTRIQWYSKRKSLHDSSIPIHEIVEIILGQKTETFQKYKQKTLAKSSFSIAYKHRKGATDAPKYLTLDLACKSVIECKLWTLALNELKRLDNNGENISQLKKLMVDVDFKDRNRPKSRQGHGKFTRANEYKEEVSISQEDKKQFQKDLNDIHKTFNKLRKHMEKRKIQEHVEYDRIALIVSESEERLQEIQEEIAHVKNVELAKRELWRAHVDLKALLEKVEVLEKKK